MLYLLTFILGGTFGFVTAALCKAAGDSDKYIDQLEHNIGNKKY